MAEVATLAVSATLRCRADTPAILGRSLVHECGLDPQVIGIDCDVRLFSGLGRVCDSRLNALFNALGGALVCVLQNRQRLIDVLSANHIYDEPRLLRRPAKILCTRS